MEPWWSHCRQLERPNGGNPGPRSRRLLPRPRAPARQPLPCAGAGPRELLCETSLSLAGARTFIHSPTNLPPDAVALGIGLSPCPTAASAKSGKGCGPITSIWWWERKRSSGALWHYPEPNSGLSRPWPAGMPLSSDGRLRVDGERVRTQQGGLLWRAGITSRPSRPVQEIRSTRN